MLKLWWWTGGRIWLPNVAIWEPVPNSTIGLPHSSGPQAVPIGGHKPSIVLHAWAPLQGCVLSPLLFRLYSRNCHFKNREISEIKKKKKNRQAGSAIVLRWLKLAEKSFIREKSTICLSEQNPNTEYYLQPQHPSTEHDWALKLGFKIPKFSSSNSAIFSLNMSFVGFSLCEQDKEAPSIFKIISIKWWNKITKYLMNEG